MKNLSIRLKLILSTGTLAFGYLLFLGLVVWTGAEMQRHLRMASDSLFPAALAGQEADAGFQKVTQDYKDAVLTQNAALLAVADEDAQKVAAQLQIVRDRTAENSALQAQVVLIQDQFKDISSQSKTTYTKMIATPDAMDEQLMSTVKSLAVANTSLTKSLKELNETIGKKDFQGELDSVVKATSLQRMLTIALFVMAFAFAILTTLLLYRQIAVPLKRAVDVLRLVAAGDLTAVLDVQSADEAGMMAEALNEALEKLRNTLQNVSESAANASSSSQQLAAASEAIASGAQEQAASLEETSASLEEITASVRQSADNAQQASQLAAGSKDSALQGQEVVSKAITAMSEINVASAKISEIISTIDEIAFQTNLLAVNAAVEAARAGDEGRGFAVVASEVRSLAQRSALAAKEIKGLIQDTLRKVDVGTALVNRSGETLQGIVGSVKRVTDIVGEIAASSAEQSTGIEQVNNAMTQMDHVTQANSAQTEELSATARTLSDESAHLMELVASFTLEVDTQNEPERHERRAVQVRATSHVVPVAPVQQPKAAQHSNSTPRQPAKQGRADVSAKTNRHARGSKGARSKPPALTVPAPFPVLQTASDASFQEF
jgi:methyl-accepting chemotaxis protein